MPQVIPLPSDIFSDYMEDFLLMSSLKLQCEEVGMQLPPTAGTWARNDLLQ